MNEMVLVSISKEGIATLTLNRPEKRNALDGEMVEQLITALHDLKNNVAVRVLIINGNGEDFCAGADIHWMKTMASKTLAENEKDALSLADLIYQLSIFEKPTIVLAHGATLGGGLGLVAAADIALASEKASFGFPEVKLGLAPSVISPYVISAIGQRATHYYFLTGEKFSSQKALELKLIHQMVSDSLIDAGLRLASSLLENGPEAMRAIKKLIPAVSGEIITEDIRHKTGKHLAALRLSDQGQEGLKAFLEKRKPKWS